MTRAGVERTDQLLTEALLNPDLARTLLMKASPGNRPFIAQRLSSQLGSLAAVGGASAAGEARTSPPPVSLSSTAIQRSSSEKSSSSYRIASIAPEQARIMPLRPCAPAARNSSNALS